MMSDLKEFPSRARVAWQNEDVPADSLLQNLSIRTTFLDIINAYPVFSNICACLSDWSDLNINALLTFRQTTKSIKKDVDTWLWSRHNINKQLLRFVNDPTAFRSRLARHNALISGSFALQFFQRVVWPESDLDIFMETGDGAQSFGRYLQENEGYRPCPQPNHPPAPGNYAEMQIDEVLTFIRGREDGTESKIQLVLLIIPPAVNILGGFYMTAVINIITWNKAYCMFPDSTIRDRKAFPLRRLEEGTQKEMDKYVERGWKSCSLKDGVRDGSLPISLLSVERRIGDGKCWTIPLNTDGVEASGARPDYVIEHHHFTVHPKKELRETMSAVAFESIAACPLRYTYTRSPGDVWSRPNKKKYFWRDFLGPKLDELTALELNKMTIEDQPKFWRDNHHIVGIHRYEYMFTRPPSWTYYDDCIPGWYKEWNEEKRKKAKNQKDA